MKWNADFYDANNSQRKEAGMALIRRAGIKDDSTILDVGCGTGTLTVEMARLAKDGRVVGIDPSDEMLAIARAKAAGLENISILKGRAEDMEFHGEFSVAYSSNALQWVPAQERALSNIHRALAPGGRLAVQLPAKGFSRALKDSIWGAIERLGMGQFSAGWSSPWHLPERDGYAALLREAGFASLEVDYEDLEYAFNSSSDALDWALSAALLPFLARMDAKEAEYFKYAVAMNFEEHRRGREIVFDFRRVIALGQRPG